MTPARARLTLFAITALFAATAGNALFLQERPRSMLTNLPSTAISITQFPVDPLPTPPARASTPAHPEGQYRLAAALQRELSLRGYASQLQVPALGLRLAVLAYEYDMGMPLTGEPSEQLLKQMLFDPAQAPKGLFADRAEANPRLVAAVQKSLAALGFFGGSQLSGRMDVWTVNGVKDFQRHRSLDVSGRLSEITLLELVTYSGQPLQLAGG
jgi:hypothetical protein